MGKFIVKETKSGGYKFDLLATNGQVIATSQVYKSLKTCLAGVDSVKRNAPVALTEDQSEENFETVKFPKFKLYVDKAGEFRFNLSAKNGQIIAVSEGYTTKKNCVNGIASVAKNAVDAPVEQKLTEAEA